MKKILILAVNDYSVSNKDGSVNSGTSITYLAKTKSRDKVDPKKYIDNISYIKETVISEVALQLKGHPIPAYFTVESEFTTTVKKDDGSTMQSLKLESIKFVKEAPIL